MPRAIEPIHDAPILFALLLLASTACDPLPETQLGPADPVRRSVATRTPELLPILTRVHVENAAGDVPLSVLMDYLAEVNHQWIASAGVCFAFDVTGWDPDETDPSQAGHPQPPLGEDGLDVRLEPSLELLGITDRVLGLTHYNACAPGEPLTSNCIACLFDPAAADACRGAVARVRAVDELVGGAQVEGPGAKYNVASTIAHELGHALLPVGVWFFAAQNAGATVGLTEHRNPEHLSVGSFGYALDPWEVEIARATATVYADATLPCYPVPGDLDFDGVIDSHDMTMLADAVDAGSDDLRYDLDRDGLKIGEPGDYVGMDVTEPAFLPGQSFVADVDEDDLRALARLRHP